MTSNKMEIVLTHENDLLNVLAHGRLDAESAPRFTEDVKRELKEGESVLIDLIGVDYVSSAGLRALLSIQKTVGGKDKMKITGVNGYVLQIFVTMGFDSLMNISTH